MRTGASATAIPSLSTATIARSNFATVLSPTTPSPGLTFGPQPDAAADAIASALNAHRARMISSVRLRIIGWRPSSMNAAEVHRRGLHRPLRVLSLRAAHGRSDRPVPRRSTGEHDDVESFVEPLVRARVLDADIDAVVPAAARDVTRVFAEFVVAGLLRERQPDLAVRSEIP